MQEFRHVGRPISERDPGNSLADRLNRRFRWRRESVSLRGCIISAVSNNVNDLAIREYRIDKRKSQHITLSVLEESLLSCLPDVFSEAPADIADDTGARMLGLQAVIRPPGIPVTPDILGRVPGSQIFMLSQQVIQQIRSTPRSTDLADGHNEFAHA